MLKADKSGVTLTLILIMDDQLYASNVGDVKALLISENNATQVTEDHSFENFKGLRTVAELVPGHSMPHSLHAIDRICSP